jgi:predicted CXXCH cytochrome family protein
MPVYHFSGLSGQKRFVTKAIIFLHLCTLCTFVLSGCSDLRRVGNSTDPQVDYKYPHPTNWSVNHVSYYMQSKGKLDKTSQDCSHCHDLQGKALPLNISCATKCHDSTTSENRDSRGVVGPNEGIVVQNECSRCHANLIPEGTQFAHFPAASGLCSTCHTASSKHLDGTDTKGVTTTATKDKCYQCHFTKEDKPNIHPALAMSDSSCVDCHDPHKSSQRYFVRAESIETLCTTCHEAPDNKSIHGPVKTGKSCLNCHNPHSTTIPKLLNKQPEDLCLSCHDKEIPTQLSTSPRVIPNIKSKIKDLPHQHTGTKNGCLSCHNPHASPNDRLLVEHYSMANYNLYDASSSDKNPYALCFQCHDPAMLNQTDYSTNFRNDKQEGDKLTQLNLHWFHVVDATGYTDKNQGRSCRICHDSHGAQQHFQINDTWSMNGFNVPIIYTPTNNGGQCTMTCHNSKTYTRQ